MKKQIFGLMLMAMPLICLAKGVGYGNTQWDMSPSEAVAVQGGKAHLIPPEKYNDNYGKVRIDNVSIGSDLYTVMFLFNSSDQLVQTNVASNERKNEAIVTRQFGYLNQLLTQKYGNPQFKDTDKVTWKTADTTIELSQMVISGIMAQTIVRYLPNSKVISDTSNL